MDKQDIKLFTILNQFSFWINDRYCPLVYDYENAVYPVEINIDTLLHLNAIGVLKFSSQIMNTHLSFSSLTQELRYCDDTFSVQIKNLTEGINIGRIILTDKGKELAHTCKIQKNDEFLSYAIVEIIKQKNIESITKTN